MDLENHPSTSSHSGTSVFNSGVNVTVKKGISGNTEGSNGNVKKAEENKMDSENHPSTSSNSGTSGFNSGVNVTVEKDTSGNAEGSSGNVKKAEEKKMYSGNRPFTSRNSRKSVYHPILEPIRNEAEYFEVILPKGRMLEKHRRSAPYHIFHTTVTAAPATHEQSNSVTFQELLDRSLGELKMSLQLNLIVDLGWLLAQYYFAGYSQKPLTIMYGEGSPSLKTIEEKKRNVEAEEVSTSDAGRHSTKEPILWKGPNSVEGTLLDMIARRLNPITLSFALQIFSKMMLLCYEDGSMRVVVSTANLYKDDWENKTQGLWMSPACPQLPDGAYYLEGESPTGFKASMLEYLYNYPTRMIKQYIYRVKRCDFSKINVFLVTSVPAKFEDNSLGMNRVGYLLSQHCRIPPEETHRWQFIAQTCSMSYFGKHPKLWLTGDFQKMFCRTQNDSLADPALEPRLRIIYPSLINVRGSHDKLRSGRSLPYSAANHIRQRWIEDFLDEWKAVKSGRNKAIPHIKSYLRVSPDYKMAAYYLLTSANISKAAWGSIDNSYGSRHTRSYEVGVLFLPSFVINEDLFPLDPSDQRHLPVPYDIPPTPYTSSMTPWVRESRGKCSPSYMDRSQMLWQIYG